MGRRRSQVRSESSLLQHAPLAVVTRAFGYTGRKVARRLLGEGLSAAPIRITIWLGLMPRSGSSPPAPRRTDDSSLIVSALTTR